MSIINLEGIEASYGAPLTVCINDCALDCGQPREELVVLCFEVGCAFAEMRWGRTAAEAFQEAGLRFGKA